mmetsp:Transcript_6410/g.11824  ORF Transcript_6410/g.11824 Transcript_6410/m.11824 type:complete len:87 (-) Transcript_6410:331-591(-)
MVKKPDGKSWRMCIDFRKLNIVTVNDKWPLPRIQDLHHSLRGSKIFSTMDALCGFWQVPSVVLCSSSAVQISHSHGARHEGAIAKH